MVAWEAMVETSFTRVPPMKIPTNWPIGMDKRRSRSMKRRAVGLRKYCSWSSRLLGREVRLV